MSVLRTIAAAFALTAAVVVGGATPAHADDVRSITFPVDGPVSFTDTFGAPRAGGRTHEGQDLMGTKLEHEVAARDGMITYVKTAGAGAESNGGNMLVLRDSEGWDIRSVERSRVEAIREAPGLSANTLTVLGVPGEPALALVRYTHRQRRAFENIRFVLEEQVQGHARALSDTEADRLYAESEWQGRKFVIVDTAGLVLGKDRDEVPAQRELRRRMEEQSRLAIAEADLVLFVLDVREGLTAVDRDIAELLRRSRTPVLVVANKADGRGREVLASEFYELGIGDPWVISALHGTGSGDLLDAVGEILSHA